MEAVYEALSVPILEVPLRAWLIAFGVMVLASGLLKAVLAGLGSRLRDRAERWEGPNPLMDSLVLLLEHTTAIFLLVLGFGLGVEIAAFPADLAVPVWTLVLMVGLVQIGLWGNQLINYGLETYRQRDSAGPAQVTSLSAFAFLGRLALWLLVLLVALQNVGVEITALITGLGIGGIAVALAVQSVLGDLFASLSIILDKPFEIGDFLIVGDYLGTIEYIGLKTTRIRSLSGEQLVFSNSDLLSRPLRNYKRMDERRVLFTFGVTYQTSADQLERIPEMVRTIIEDQEQTRFDRAHFKEYGDSSLVFEVVYYMLVPDYNVYMDTQHAINVALYRRFEEEDISFAYPTRTVYVAEGTGPGDASPGGRASSTEAPPGSMASPAEESPYGSGSAG